MSNDSGALSPSKINMDYPIIIKKMDLEKFKECPKCKYKMLFKEAKFCSQCGYKLEENKNGKNSK